MRHAITDLDKAQALLDDLEPTSGGRAALEAEIAHMYREDPQPEPADEPEPPYQALPTLNGPGVLWPVLITCLIWGGVVIAVRWA